MKDLHLPEVDDFFLLCCRVDRDNTNRSAHPKSPIQDVNSQNNRITFTEGSYNLQSARPYRLRSRVPSLRLHDLVVISSEGVEQMVDDVSCMASKNSYPSNSENQNL
jgi:hypothetical protein